MSIRFTRVALMTWVICTLATTSAFADGAVYGGAGIANLNDLASTGQFGLGAQVGFRWGFTDYLALFTDITSSYHFEQQLEEDVTLPPQVIGQLAVGLRYNLDVFTYVPWVALAATAYAGSPQSEDFGSEFNAGTKLSIGVDWRFDRDWSVGGYAEMHALWTALDRFPLYTQLGINGTYHFRF